MGRRIAYNLSTFIPEDRDIKRFGFIHFTRSKLSCVGTKKDEPGEAEAVGRDIIPGCARDIVATDLLPQQQLAVLENFNLCAPLQ